MTRPTGEEGLDLAFSFALIVIRNKPQACIVVGMSGDSLCLQLNSICLLAVESRLAFASSSVSEGNEDQSRSVTKAKGSVV